MTIEPFDNPDNYHVRQPNCPFCDEALTPGRDFPTHWPDCPQNSKNDDEEQGATTDDA